MAARAGARSWADLLLAEEAPRAPGPRAPVSFDVRAAVGLDLDQAGPGGQRVGETRQILKPTVRQAEELCRLGHVDPARVT